MRHLQRLCACALTALAAFSAQAESIEGTLEHGAGHSVLWFLSPESGDLVGQVLHNASPAGQTILANCLPGLYCEVDGVSLIELPEEQAQSLGFSIQPSGWWLIDQARSASMKDNLPMNEQAIQTRFGPLRVQDQQLFHKGAPVMAEAPDGESAAASSPAATPAPASPTAAASSSETGTAIGWRARLGQWFDGLLRSFRQRIAALLGSGDTASAQAPASEPAKPAAPAVAHTTPAKLEPVIGNNALHIVAHTERKTSDLVLLQSVGGSGCPAQYRIATLSSAGITVTPEFGSCSDLAALTEPDAGSGAEWVLAMPGFLGPFGTPDEQSRAAHQLHRYAFQQGVVREVTP